MEAIRAVRNEAVDRMRMRASAFISDSSVPLMQEGQVSLARDALRNTPRITMRESKTHSHPAAAANRAEAVAMMKLFSHSMGMESYMLQMSKRDQEAGMRGSRQYFWARDTDMRAVEEDPRPGECICIVDTDYYVDMPRMLLRNSNPVIMYTMMPTRAGEVLDSDVTFAFNQDNEVVTTVAGGARYQHHLWDYTMDVLTVRSRVLCWRTKTYQVERLMLSRHHGIVLLIPRHMWRGLGSWLMWFMGGHSLTTMQPSSNGWVRMEVVSGKDHYVSVAKAGSCVSAEIPIAVDEGLRATTSVVKTPLTISGVESQIHKHGLDHARAALLCQYYRETVGTVTYKAFPVEMAVKRLQYRALDFDVKPAMDAFMCPIVNNAVVPDCTLGNEQQCVEERINKVKNPELEMTPQLMGYMIEFSKLLFPRAGMHVPADEDEVWERQARPAQQRILDEAQQIDEPNRIVKAFQKKEAYIKVNDPRNISTINGKDKLEYSRYMYAFSEQLKTQPWYAFAMTPKSIADRVVFICETADFVIPSDYSRFDGTVSNLSRIFEEIVAKRCFAPSYHADLVRLMRTQFAQKAVGSFGTWYETGFSRLSGSPETSCFNTLNSAFSAFVAKRLEGCPAAEAYTALGVYGGDDGLTPNVDPEKFKQAAAMMGFRLTCEVVHKGQPGVTFLARTYTPEVWFGNPTSSCQLLRQLSKFHVTVASPGVSEVTKLVQKSYSFYLSDRNTPIIGPFVRRTMELLYASDLKCKLKLDPEIDFKGLRSYMTLHPVDEQYPNKVNEWFEDYAQEQIPGFDQNQWTDWLDSVEKLEDLLKPPCLLDPESPPKPDAAVNFEKAPLEIAAEAIVPAAPVEIKKKKTHRGKRSGKGRNSSHARGKAAVLSG